VKTAPRKGYISGLAGKAYSLLFGSSPEPGEYGPGVWGFPTDEELQHPNRGKVAEAANPFSEPSEQAEPARKGYEPARAPSLTEQLRGLYVSTGTESLFEEASEDLSEAMEALRARASQYVDAGKGFLARGADSTVEHAIQAAPYAWMAAKGLLLPPLIPAFAAAYLGHKAAEKAYVYEGLKAAARFLGKDAERTWGHAKQAAGFLRKDWERTWDRMLDRAKRIDAGLAEAGREFDDSEIKRYLSSLAGNAADWVNMGANALELLFSEHVGFFDGAVPNDVALLLEKAERFGRIGRMSYGTTEMMEKALLNDMRQRERMSKDDMEYRKELAGIVESLGGENMDDCLQKAVELAREVDRVNNNRPTTRKLERIKGELVEAESLGKKDRKKVERRLYKELKAEFGGRKWGESNSDYLQRAMIKAINTDFLGHTEYAPHVEELADMIRKGAYADRKAREAADLEEEMMEKAADRISARRPDPSGLIHADPMWGIASLTDSEEDALVSGIVGSESHTSSQDAETFLYQKMEYYKKAGDEKGTMRMRDISIREGLCDLLLETNLEGSPPITDNEMFTALKNELKRDVDPRRLLTGSDDVGMRAIYMQLFSDINTDYTRMGGTDVALDGDLFSADLGKMGNSVDAFMIGNVQGEVINHMGKAIKGAKSLEDADERLEMLYRWAQDRLFVGGVLHKFDSRAMSGEERLRRYCLREGPEAITEEIDGVLMEMDPRMEPDDFANTMHKFDNRMIKYNLLVGWGNDLDLPEYTSNGAAGKPAEWFIKAFQNGEMFYREFHARPDSKTHPRRKFVKFVMDRMDYYIENVPVKEDPPEES
jgi:hypothetical protein